MAGHFEKQNVDSSGIYYLLQQPTFCESNLLTSFFKHFPSYPTQCVSWEMFLKKCLWFLQVMSSEMSVPKISAYPNAIGGLYFFACSWNNAPFRFNAMPTLHPVVAMQKNTLHKTPTPRRMAPLRGLSTVPLITLAKKNLLNHFKDF
jgi:hypothetical protein